MHRCPGQSMDARCSPHEHSPKVILASVNGKVLTGWCALAQSLAEGPPVLAAVLAHLDVGHHWARPGGLVAAIAAAAAEVARTAILQVYPSVCSWCCTGPGGIPLVNWAPASAL